MSLTINLCTLLQCLFLKESVEFDCCSTHSLRIFLDSQWFVIWCLLLFTDGISLVTNFSSYIFIRRTVFAINSTLWSKKKDLMVENLLCWLHVSWNISTALWIADFNICSCTCFHCFSIHNSLKVEGRWCCFVELTKVLTFDDPLGFSPCSQLTWSPMKWSKICSSLGTKGL